MAYRFLHSSDLHLGKAFGGFPEDIRGRLREARHGVIGRLAQAARGAGLRDVLLAGDTFDAETPAPETLRHALQAMAAEGDLRWYLMPGNHDSLAASELWLRIAREAPANLILLQDSAPLMLTEGVWLLPAPSTQRRPGRDLTEAMSATTPAGALRIGLGHGAITDFTGEEGSPGIIPPDRARLSGLDYLGLGDWHGQMQVGPATWYSGTPEADGFKHAGAASALVVSLTAPGALPQVEVVPTGQFRWHRPGFDLLPGEPLAARLADLLPATSRRDALVQLRATGRLTLSERAGFEAALAAIAPDFGWFEADLSALGAEILPGDLDLIDRGGALRRAAEVLAESAADSAAPRDSRDLAEAALGRLYALVQEVQP